MIRWIFGFFSFLVGIWSKVPESAKEKIINIIVETFDAVFREYFHSVKRKEGKENA